MPLIFALSKNWRFDRWIGELSYPIYICHTIVAAVLVKCGVPLTGARLLLCTVPVAIIIRLLIEQPFDRLRQRIHKGKPAPAETLAPAPCDDCRQVDD